jgi:hypothetical protein
MLRDADPGQCVHEQLIGEHDASSLLVLDAALVFGAAVRVHPEWSSLEYHQVLNLY